MLVQRAPSGGRLALREAARAQNEPRRPAILGFRKFWTSRDSFFMMSSDDVGKNEVSEEHPRLTKLAYEGNHWGSDFPRRFSEIAR
jgi:hypothetical protein